MIGASGSLAGQQVACIRRALGLWFRSSSVLVSRQIET